MNHADVRTKMADYLEGHLDITDRALFDAHLDGCSDCAAEISQMRATIGLLRSLPEPEVPGAFSADVMRRIRAGDAAPTFVDRVSAFFESVTSPRILAPASAAVLSAGFVFWGQQVGILDSGTLLLPAAAEPAGLVVLDESADPSLNSSGNSSDNRSGNPFATPSGSPPASRVAMAIPSPGMPGPRRLAKALESDRGQLAGLGPVQSVTASRVHPGSSLERTAPAPVLHFTIALHGVPSPYQVESRQPTHVQIPFRSLDIAEGKPPRSLAVASTSGARPGDRASRNNALRGSASTSGEAYGILAESSPAEPRSRDDWLAILETNPREFAARLSTLTLAEQELWVDRLARHAAEQGSLDRVVERLRSAGGAGGRLLADDFVAVGQGDLSP